MDCLLIGFSTGVLSIFLINKFTELNQYYSIGCGILVALLVIKLYGNWHYKQKKK